MKLTMIEAINKALAFALDSDKRVHVLGEDVGVDGGVFRATDGLYKKFPGRVIDTPLSESGIIGTAIGMAIAGLKPIAEIQFSGFLAPAFDQLISHASRIRNRSRGSYSCPLIVRAPHHAGFRALEHHGESTEAIYAHIAGLTVVIPSTPYDAKGLLIAALQKDDPVLFFEPAKLYRSVRQEVPEEAYTVPVGQASVVREGEDLTIVTYSTMVQPCLDVSEKISAEVIDLRTISPLDEETIIKSVKKTGRCLIVHEAPHCFGVGAEVSARIGEKALSYLEAPIIRVAGYDVPLPYFQLENKYIPSKQRILDGIKRVMQY
jgi:pyruvate dehydrogenase E1 component beta subunit